MRDRANRAQLVVIIGAFASGVLLFVFTGAPSRLIGSLLLAGGLVAVAGARGIAAAAAKPDVVRVMSLGTSTRSTLRATTVALWGAGVALVGLLIRVGL